jgi:murein L,D-transpeptidase YafK
MSISTWAMSALVAAAITTLPPAPPTPSRAHVRAPNLVTQIRIHKTSHTMELWSDGTRVGTYPVSLGPGGAGFKHREGDKVTPVGHYHVVNRGPSQFKVFMRLDYPNAEDWKRFRDLRASGELPKGATIGGDIGIHGGTPVGYNKRDDVTMESRDWTLGCIGVEDDEIVAIAKMTPDGTAVDIDDL